MTADPAQQPAVDIVVVHFNAPDSLDQCLAPLRDSLQSRDWTLTLVDNDGERPAEQARRLLESTDGARYLKSPTNDGFGAASNRGARRGKAPYILFLNPDCIIGSEGVRGLAQVLKENPQVVAVGPRIVRPSGAPEISWAHHPGFLWEARRRRLWMSLDARKDWAIKKAAELVSKPRDVEWLTAACLMVRREAFEAIGGFDESFFLYFEDADLGLRLGRHGILRFDPCVEVEHAGGASTAKDKSGTLHHYRASQRLYYKKHRALWERLALRAWRVLKP